LRLVVGEQQTSKVRPETRYAKTTDGVHLAYQVVGEGSIDIIFVIGWTTNVEALWEEPSLARFLARLASISRLIVFDKRGVGLSDRVPEAALPTLETRMDDVRAVMEAAGSERAVVLGVSEGGPLSILFAATYPERTIALILFGTMARFAWAPDFPWGVTEEQARDVLDAIDRSWGTEEYASSALRSWAAPGSAEDPRLVSWLASYTRRAASPGAAMALERMNFGMDVRHILGAIHVPTLVLARIGDLDFPIDATRQMAGQIQGAKLVEFPGDDHFFWIGDQGALLDEIERFMAGVSDDEAELDRVLATVLFTDIVGSTARAAALGDRRWTEVLEAHHARIRSLLARFRGKEVDTAGDGFLATFDGPIRAVRCAVAATHAVKDIGLEIRAGIHTGEVELSEAGVRGIAVHIGARVAGLAGASEVLASSTVKDLVAGSALRFEDFGEHALKGVPGVWRLYRVLD
jgi:pimeloyl-ACP methyl ester carboxylesterase/class 3 adenylate cyclase